MYNSWVSLLHVIADCSCRITDNPLQDLAAVSLDPASEQAAFSVWESQHNTAALQEVDLVTPEYETDMMVRQIENITEVGSPANTQWNTSHVFL